MEIINEREKGGRVERREGGRGSHKINNHKMKPIMSHHTDELTNLLFNVGSF